MLKLSVLKNIGPISMNFVLDSITAHGVMMSIAFVILFPLGALSIRFFNFKGLVWVHAALQIFAFTVALAAFGLGVANATWQERLNLAHPIIGIIVVGLLAFQPFLGLIHHYVYLRTQRRTFWAQSHVWFGRGLITLGIINGGLGLQLANNSKKGEIAYGVIAGIVLVVYLGVSLIGQRGGNEAGNEDQGVRNMTEKTASSPSESQNQGHGHTV